MEGKRHLTLDIQACFETCTTQPFPLDNWISNDNTYVKFFFRNETLYQLKQQIPIFYNIIHDPHFKVISPKFQVLLRQFTKLYLAWWKKTLLTAIFDLTAATRLEIWGK
jgi:hypothetical protein